MRAAVGNPKAYVQAKAGSRPSRSPSDNTHAAQTAFPGATERSEERIFGA
jgi:hypothetical protein